MEPELVSQDKIIQETDEYPQQFFKDLFTQKFEKIQHLQLAICFSVEFFQLEHITNASSNISIIFMKLSHKVIFITTFIEKRKCYQSRNF